MQVSLRPCAGVFDVLGTLLPLESLRPLLVACGLPGLALETWFAASLRDLFALGVTGRTAPMLFVLRDNLRQLLPAYRLRSTVRGSRACSTPQLGLILIRRPC